MMWHAIKMMMHLVDLLMLALVIGASNKKLCCSLSLSEYLPAKSASVHNDDNNNDDFIIFYCKFLASVSSNFMPVNISLCFRLLVLRMDKNNVTRLLRHLMSSNRAQSMNPEVAAGSCIRSD